MIPWCGPVCDLPDEVAALHELIDGANHDGQLAGAMRWTPPKGGQS